MKQIAERLRLARLAINPNQTEFATRAGLSQHRYNQYETGKRPLTLDAAMCLRDAYGISLDWLFYNDGEMMPHGLMRRIEQRAVNR